MTNVVKSGFGFFILRYLCISRMNATWSWPLVFENISEFQLLIFIWDFLILIFKMLFVSCRTSD